MKRIVIIISALIAIVVISAFGFVDEPIAKKTSDAESQIDSTNFELSYFGINGGLTVSNYNGSVSQFVSADMELFYLVRRKYMSSSLDKRYVITKEKLQQANSISDVIENYPSSWISDYNSVEISIILNGKELKAIGADAILTKEQKELFNLIEIGTDVHIDVNYKKENYNAVIENRQMNVSMTVTPKKEAEYLEGYNQMISYLKENSTDQISAKNFKLLPQPSISFIVNENGNIENVELIKTSGDDEIDKLLVELVEKMPKWNPAKNAKGLPVKQGFVLEIGQGRC
ncbi:MAG: energy transducer TonB [Flavobacteriales bacterium]|nr:energy transducer TonB [Flavobacteriales bacterium]